jgi:hypothetical protein
MKTGLLRKMTSHSNPGEFIKEAVRGSMLRIPRGRIRPRKKPVPGKMNPLEKNYADILEYRKLAGEIVTYRFEAMKFRLADKTFLTPDFMVTFEDRIEFHEVKGFWEEDARVKTKVVAEMFPEFGFVAVQHRKNTGWTYEEF